ncbi:MAG: glycosyltransferase [Pontibacterium sp.]
MKIVSSHRPAKEQVHPGMDAIQDEVDYLCDASFKDIIVAHLLCLLRYPYRYLKSLFLIFFMQEGRLTSLKHISGAALVLRRCSGSGDHMWIHSHFTYGATAIALWIKRIAGCPYSLTLHGSDLIFDNPPDLAAKLQEADAVICISQFNADYVKSHFPAVAEQRLIVLPLGVEPLGSPPNLASRAKKKPFRILSVGRLSTQKAQEYLVRACAILRDQGLAFECLLVGEGPQRSLLEKEIKGFGLEAQIHLTGAKYHHEVLEMYQDADLFVMCSVAEGMPIVLMEAMQAGVPVLSTSISGIPELLDHGNAGILVPPADAEALADAVRGVIEGDIDIAALKQSALNHIATHFDQGTNAVRFKQLLERLANDV